MPSASQDGVTRSRAQARQDWLAGVIDGPFELRPASEDASFRRYFRVFHATGTQILMDAPPEHEDCRPYVRVARAFAGIGLNAPEVHAEDLAQGFLLLTDLGDRQYLSELTPASVDRLYGDALGALATLQACGPRDLPPYDAGLLQREMQLFFDWYLARHLGRTLSPSEQSALDAVRALLVQAALEQPQVAVHRDYHSRNLMVVPGANPGILDFQDAVHGPVTYDLVSLLRDCYIAWPRARVEHWALGYLDLARQRDVLRETDAARFLRWFDLMGVQRHLKAAGIFARLHHRDGKSGFLKDIPRTLNYVAQVAARHRELAPLGELLARLPAA